MAELQNGFERALAFMPRSSEDCSDTGDTISAELGAIGETVETAA
jgi:hypothetical protein